MLNLKHFLNSHRVKRGQNYTHTAVGNMIGSYYIPQSKMEHFYQLYNDSFLENNIMYLTEKPLKHYPILVDIDFKFKMHCIKRKYNEKHISNIVSLYFKVIDIVLELGDELQQAFILEKDKPTIKKGYCQDGIHIVFPYILTDTNTQQIIRKKVVEEIIFEDLDLINNADDIFDKNINYVNWTMYGSTTKVNRTPYKLTMVLDNNLNKIGLCSKEKIVSILSVRKMIKSANVRKQFRKKIIEEKKEKRSKIENNNVNVDFAKELVNLLSIERVDNYNDWIRVGWCLFNISDDLLDTWIAFSKKSNKYKDGECQKIWNKSYNKELTIGSLCYWAKQDNYKQYCKLRKKYKNRMDTSNWFGIDIFKKCLIEPEYVDKQEWFGLHMVY